jgi:hypothetical protein
VVERNYNLGKGTKEMTIVVTIAKISMLFLHCENVSAVGFDVFYIVKLKPKKVARFTG